MGARKIVLLSTLACGCVALARADDIVIDAANVAAAAPEVAVETGITDLKRTLVEVLKARRQEEFDYIDKVTTFVDQKKLPREMVESTFNWARKKPRHQFQYFEAALRVRAKAIGVDL
jgi:thioesterase domain-containing protein